MNGIDFFFTHLGRFMVKPTGNVGEDVQRAINGALPRVQKEGKSAAAIRLTTGEFAIVRAAGSTLYAQVSGLPVETRKANWNEEIVRCLLGWTGEPVLFAAFDKVLFPPQNLFVTYDLRRVRLCRAKGVDDIDFSRVKNQSVSIDALAPPEQTLRRTLDRMNKSKAADVA